jgi:hypothetical protein
MFAGVNTGNTILLTVGFYYYLKYGFVAYQFVLNILIRDKKLAESLNESTVTLLVLFDSVIVSLQLYFCLWRFRLAETKLEKLPELK